MIDSVLNILEYYKVLDIIASFATSEPGAEKVKRLRPKTDIEMLNTDLARVEEMIFLQDRNQTPPFKGIYDLEQSLKNASIAGAMLHPEPLVKIAVTLACARLVKKFLLDRAKDVSHLADMAQAMTTFEELESAVHHAIDETGEIRDTASPALKHIRTTIAVEKSKARAALARIMKEWQAKGFLQEEVIASREGRLTLPVRDSSKGRVKGILVDQSASGSTFFIEPLETVEINNVIRNLELEERREIERILREITAIVYRYRFEIADTVNVLLILDTIFALAEYARKYDCTKPQLAIDNTLRIICGRHPLLLIKEKQVVPLTLELEEGIFTLVISGPNAGGKTVALKTVGILDLMAMAGCFIPAGKGTILPLPQEIHAVIGDEQSIAADLSTFTAHLAKLTKVVETDASRKLVLIDEVMSGTDPAEGTALAIALLEKLTGDQALTLVTTHKGDLKAFAHRAPGVINGSLEFDPHTLSPTYRFLMGIPGSSYAFAVAKKVGLPDPLIEKAQSLRGEDVGALENLLIELQKKLTSIEQAKIASAAAQSKAESLQRQLEDKLQNVKSIEAKLKEKAEAEAEKILAEASRAVEQAVREIREKGATKESIKSAHESITFTRESFRSRRKRKHFVSPEEREPLKIGDRVRFEEGETQGVIMADKDAKGRFLVEAGGIRIWVEEAKLLKLPSVKEDAQRQKVKVKYQISSENLSAELDLRGQDSQQARMKLEEYLVQAASANFHRVDIIHGKGNGILRRVVSEVVAGNSLVKSFKPGEWGQGDYGVTVVELKE